MSSDAEAQAAITALNGTEMGGRTLTVNEARPQEPRTGGGGLVGAVVVAVQRRQAPIAGSLASSVRTGGCYREDNSPFFVPALG